MKKMINEYQIFKNMFSIFAIIEMNPNIKYRIGDENNNYYDISKSILKESKEKADRYMKNSKYILKDYKEESYNFIYFLMVEYKIISSCQYVWINNIIDEEIKLEKDEDKVNHKNDIFKKYKKNIKEKFNCKESRGIEGLLNKTAISDLVNKLVEGRDLDDTFDYNNERKRLSNFYKRNIDFQPMYVSPSIFLFIYTCYRGDYKDINKSFEEIIKLKYDNCKYKSIVEFYSEFLCKIDKNEKDIGISLFYFERYFKVRRIISIVNNLYELKNDIKNMDEVMFTLASLLFCEDILYSENQINNVFNYVKQGKCSDQKLKTIYLSSCKYNLKCNIETIYIASAIVEYFPKIVLFDVNCVIREGNKFKNIICKLKSANAQKGYNNEEHQKIYIELIGFLDYIENSEYINKKQTSFNKNNLSISDLILIKKDYEKRGKRRK